MGWAGGGGGGESTSWLISMASDKILTHELPQVENYLDTDNAYRLEQCFDSGKGLTRTLPPVRTYSKVLCRSMSLVLYVYDVQSLKLSLFIRWFLIIAIVPINLLDSSFLRCLSIH